MSTDRVYRQQGLQAEESEWRIKGSKQRQPEESSMRVSCQRQQSELEATAEAALKQKHRKSRGSAAAAELQAVAGPTGSRQQSSFFSHRQSCLIYGSSLAAAEAKNIHSHF